MHFEVRWRSDRSLFTGVSDGGGSAHEGQETGWGRGANTGAGQLVTVSGTLPLVVQNVDGAVFLGFTMFLRIARAPAHYVTDSSFVELGVASGEELHRGGHFCGRTFWRRETDAWGGLGAKPRSALLSLCNRVLSLLTVGLEMTWLMLLASWWF